MRVSPFSSAYSKHPSAPVEVDRILDAIKTGKWQKEITELRALKGEEYKARKLKLAGFKVSGVFYGKSDDTFVEHSSLVQIDIDHSLNPDTPYKDLWNKTLGMPNLYAAFKSPSGRGIKALVRCKPDRESHAGSYLAAANWFDDHGVKVDRQVCALSQLCFCSFDPDLYVNRKARPIVPVECPPSEYALVEFEETRTDGEILDACRDAWPDVFQQLWDGEFEGDHSAADHQLISILREGCMSNERVAELFQQSGLYRPEKHNGRTRDYVFRSLTKCGAVKALSLLSVIPEDPEDPSPVKKRRKGIWGWTTAADIGEWQPSDDKYIVKRMLYEGTCSCIYGPSGSGKSFLVANILAAITTGIPWRGMKTRKGGCMYFGLEGHHGITKRIQGMKKAGHLTEEGNALFAKVECAENSLNLLEEGHVKRVVNTVAAFEEESGHKCKLIVVDTLARATPGGDENSGKDMGQVLIHAQMIADATGCCVLVVHHTGKDASRGLRGHSSLPAGFDTTFEVSFFEEDSPVRVFSFRKQRDEAKAADTYFKLDVVVLGIDEDLEEVSTCVPRYLEDDEIPVKKEKGRSSTMDLESVLVHIPEEGITLEELESLAALSRSALQRRLGPLAENGTIRKDGNNVYRMPEDVF